MRATVFAAADWGTSHLRLYLCRGHEVLDTRRGPGIGALSASPEETLFELIAPWVRAHGKLPVWLAGMIGSRNGWVEAPYVPCPASADSIAAAVVRFDANGHPIAIVPGLSCTNPCGAPDVLRGEEAQIIGALANDPALAVGRHVLVLPGTHTKWALVDQGRITTFQTSLSGELFAVLRDHSMLARVSADTGNSAGGVRKRDALARGLARSRELAQVPLIHLLFEVRSRQLIADLDHEQALGFLSGLIIGHDVIGGVALFKDALSRSAPVTLIGAPDLADLYSAALGQHGVEANVANAAELTLAGLRSLAARSHPTDVLHAAAH